MIVGCKLPHGHTIEHNGETIALNGQNAGYDAANPWRNGYFPESSERTSGAGLTVLEGAQADAFKDWHAKNKTGGPVAAGTIFFTDKIADAKAEAKGRENIKTGLDPLDPAADLPKGLETAKED